MNLNLLRARAFCLASALLSAATGFGQSVQEATHQGRNVEQWFQAYVAGADERASPTAPSAANGEFRRSTPARDKPDPAWDAFRALGEKSVPCLTGHLTLDAPEPNSGLTAANPMDRGRERLERERKRLERRQAIELIHRLGVAARAAAPALLALLQPANDPDEEEVCAALRSIHAEPQIINGFLLEFAKQHRDADVLRFARLLGWSGQELASQLGDLLRSPNPEICRGAITLLEAAGPGARPAADRIVATLKHPDQEIRYLAARSLAQLATNTPAAVEALRTLTGDRNEMVRKVARQALGPERNER